MYQYYVAVGCAQSKLATLKDLLHVFHEAPQASPLCVVCSSRDTLDDIICRLSEGNEKLRIACWHADMEENELLQIARMVQDNNLPTRELPVSIDTEKPDERFVHPDDVRGNEVEGRNTTLITPSRQGDSGPIVLVTTDTALRNVPSHVLPLGARVVINYDLPSTKEEHNRRLTKGIGNISPEHPTRAAIHFVVAGQMATFRALEKLANAPIHEMPVHAADILS